MEPQLGHPRDQASRMSARVELAEPRLLRLAQLVRDVPAEIGLVQGRALRMAIIGRGDLSDLTETGGQGRLQPGHEAADANGYVKMPNVNVLIEMADMTEANRSYEANLQIIKRTRELLSMTIDLLRNQS